MAKQVKVARKATDLVKLFQRVFNTEDGKEVLHYLSKEANFLQPSWNPALGLDPTSVYYEEGKRSLYLYILTQLEKKPEQMLENYRRQREKEKRYEDMEY